MWEGQNEWAFLADAAVRFVLRLCNPTLLRWRMVNTKQDIKLTLVQGAVSDGIQPLFVLN